MGTPNGTGASKRLRIAGLALVGLAVIAALIGLVVATTRDEQTSATAPPAATPTPDAVPSTIPYPPPVTSSPAAAPIVPVPRHCERQAGPDRDRHKQLRVPVSARPTRQI
jgi:hypothetical protein